MPRYLMGYGDEIVEYAGQDDVDEILEALSGNDDEYWDDYMGQVPVPPQAARAKAFMRPQRPRQFRKYPLGLGTTSIGALATAVITVNPQLPFKLTRLSTAVAGMMVENIQIGTVSQFVAAGGIPTEVFAPNAQDVDLKGDTAVPGVAIQITVTNPGGAPANFTGALLGLVAQ